MRKILKSGMDKEAFPTEIRDLHWQPTRIAGGMPPCGVTIVGGPVIAGPELAVFMKKTKLPPDEIERIAALHALRILDTPPEQLYDRVTQLLAGILDVPMTFISFIDTKRQWFKSYFGPEIIETPRDISFCAHALFSDDALVVEDAREDERFADNPLVTGPPYIRFYAGMPLHSAEGHIVGTLGCIDPEPRHMSESELAILRNLAVSVEELLEQRHIAGMTRDLLRVSQQREERYRSLIQRLPDTILMHEDGNIVFINDAGLAMLGAEREEQLLNRPLASIIACDSTGAGLAFSGNGQPEQGTSLREEVWQRLDGSRLFVETFSVPFVFSDKAMQVIARDITERKHAQHEMERLSTRDLLTGLPNRVLLMDRLHHAIAQWQRHGRKGLVAMFDVDHFKEINNTLGQSVGDQVLVAVANNLGSLLSEGDTVARIAGDVFVVVLEDEASEAPPDILRYIFDTVSHPFRVAAQQISVTFSVGYCCYPGDGDSPEMLLNSAQAAMYRAKELGRANIQAFHKEMRPAANERFLMESQLRQAIERDELELHYQPKVRLENGRIVGVEALVRWRHPEQGLVPPMRFIPLAEETGLIVPMGEWITREACQQVRRWQHESIADVSIAINLSSRQFLQPDIVESVRQAMVDAGIEPGCLEFELTESLAMGNPEKSAAIMDGFKDLGVSLSVDDFGTGYSNLSHLIRFPVDKIKIDQSFIRNMMENMEAQAIVKAIIRMGRTLKLTVVAEGVETEEEFSLLAQNRCHEIQGYYFSKPLPAEQCSQFILSTPYFQMQH